MILLHFTALKCALSGEDIRISLEGDEVSITIRKEAQDKKPILS